jgi:hypothetical protein
MKFMFHILFFSQHFYFFTMKKLLTLTFALCAMGAMAQKVVIDGLPAEIAKNIKLERLTAPPLRKVPTNLPDNGGEACTNATALTLPTPGSCANVGTVVPPTVTNAVDASAILTANGGTNTGCASVGGTGLYDTWYSITTPATGVAALTFSGAGPVGRSGCGGNAECPAFVYQIFTGTCTGLTQTDCGLLTLRSGTDILLLSNTSVVLPSTTYYVRVTDFFDSNSTFTLSVRPVPAPPANDQCANALSLNTDPPGQAVAGCNFGAFGGDWSPPSATVANGGYNVGACNGNGWSSMDNSVFYKFGITSAQISAAPPAQQCTTAGGQPGLLASISAGGISCNGGVGTSAAQMMLMRGSCVNAAANFISCNAGVGSVNLPPTGSSCFSADTYTVVVDGNSGDNCKWTMNTVGIPIPPLPVSFDYFKAVPSDQHNLLNWRTLSESNNDRFEIQRSVNEQIYTTIGVIKGAGTTDIVQNYTYTDKAPTKVSYYRIKQIDTDGKFSYSVVVKVVAKTNQIAITDPTPNPTQSHINFNVIGSNNNDMRIKLMDITGKIIFDDVMQMQIGSNTYNYDVQLLPNGVYYIAAQDTKTKEQAFAKFVKQ